MDSNPRGQSTVDQQSTALTNRPLCLVKGKFLLSATYLEKVAYQAKVNKAHVFVVICLCSINQNYATEAPLPSSGFFGPDSCVDDWLDTVLMLSSKAKLQKAALCLTNAKRRRYLYNPNAYPGSLQRLVVTFVVSFRRWSGKSQASQDF